MNLRESVLIALVAMIFLPQGLNANVLFGPITNPANGHAYFLLSESSWQSAQTEAVSLGGTLVTINDSTEQSWVFTTFGAFGGQNRSLWLGLTDQVSEGSFAWVSGESFGYVNWLAGQPDNAYEDEHYVHMIRDGLGVTDGPWNDISSPSTPFSYFGPMNGVVEVNSPSVLFGPVLNPANHHSYYLLNSSSWQAAQAQALTYTNWLPGLPDNAYDNENYVHMMRTGNGFGHPGGAWNDLACPISPFPQFDPINGVVEVNSIPTPAQAVTWGFIKSR